MPSARRNNEDAPLIEIELERNANIARNKAVLASLIPPRPEVQHDQAKKKIKRLITQVLLQLHQLHNIICAQGHREIMLRVHKSGLMKI